MQITTSLACATIVTFVYSLVLTNILVQKTKRNMLWIVALVMMIAALATVLKSTLLFVIKDKCEDIDK